MKPLKGPRPATPPRWQRTAARTGRGLRGSRRPRGPVALVRLLRPARSGAGAASHASGSARSARALPSAGPGGSAASRSRLVEAAGETVRGAPGGHEAAAQRGGGRWGRNMSSSCLGLRRACFLLSVTAAAVLLLLLPRGQPPAAPRRRPPPAGPSRPSPKREARPAGSDVPGDRGGGSGAAGGGRGVAGSPWPSRRVRMGPPGGSAKESLELKDIFIAVKTTRKYHKTRLELLFQTWISRARGQVSAGPRFTPAASTLGLSTAHTVRLWKTGLRTSSEFVL